MLFVLSYYLLHTCVQLYLRTVPTWEQNLGVFQLLSLEGLCDCCIFFSKTSNQNVTDDLMPNSPVFHQQIKVDLKENLAVYHSISNGYNLHVLTCKANLQSCVTHSMTRFCTATLSSFSINAKVFCTLLSSSISFLLKVWKKVKDIPIKLLNEKRTVVTKACSSLENRGSLEHPCSFTN